MPPLTPAVRRAANAVAQLAAENPDSRLPPIATLCSQLKCSARTLSAALAFLRQRGTVRVVPRAGVFSCRSAVAAAAPPPAPLRRTTTYWERLRERLLDDINRSGFPPGERLPSGKELCNRYGCAPATLRKALSSIASTRRIEPFRHWYRVPAIPSRHGSGTVLVLTKIRQMGILAALSPRAYDVWRNLQRECRLAGVELRLETIDTIDDAYWRRAQRSRDRTLGCVVVTMAMHTSDLARFVETLGHTQARVAMLDEDGTIDPLRATMRSPRIAIVRMGMGRQPGGIVGDFLIRHGHRRVAYFPLNPGWPSDDTRCGGVRDAFEQAGLNDAVTVYWPRGLERRRIGKLLDANPVYRQVHQRAYALWNDSRFETSAEYVPFIPAYADHLAIHSFMREHMRQCFREALDNKDVTAWVAYNDRQAFVALEFLRAQGVRLPERLSLIGFDNSIEAIGSGLASYDFNVGAVVHAMLEHILGPPRSHASEPGEPIDIAGLVEPRLTAGRAPRH